MTEPHVPSPAETIAEDPKRRGLGRWLAVAAVLLLGVAAVALIGSGGGGGEADPRAATMALQPEDVAPSAAAAVRRVNPPVDVGAVERGVKAATLGQVPMPASRQVTTYQRTDTHEEITHAVLVYDDAVEAASLDRLAAPLLGSAFDMEELPLDLPGTQDARRWSGHGYDVATFRVGGVVTVVATTSQEPGALEELAARARDKAVAHGSAGVTPVP